jgi:hypothetical protein
MLLQYHNLLDIKYHLNQKEGNHIFVFELVEIGFRIPFQAESQKQKNEGGERIKEEGMKKQKL